MTGRALLNPSAAEHLCKLLGDLGSTFDGEALNASRLADQFVKQLGLRWCDIIVAAPTWQTMALQVRAHRHMLSEREIDFRQHRTFASAAEHWQLKWLIAIYERLQEREAA